jgi:hypothetical protein
VRFICGSFYVAVTAAFVPGAFRAWWGILTAAVLGLWYLPFGTMINSCVILLLLLPRLRSVTHWAR